MSHLLKHAGHSRLTWRAALALEAAPPQPRCADIAGFSLASLTLID
jgi:hypothetical protein